MLGGIDSTLGRRALGAAAILGGIVLVVLAVWRPNPFANTHSIWAQFDSVQGLGSIDRDVRVAGVNVGKIGAVRRVGDDAQVELVLNSDVTVHSDARADLRPHTLFEGTAFVDLSPGSPSAPMLGDGGLIPRDHTTVYVSLDQTLRILRQPNRNGLRSIVRTASRTLRGGAVSGLQQTLRSAPRLTRSLAPASRALLGPHGDELAGVVSGLNRTVAGVAAHEAQLTSLAGRTDKTLSALETHRTVPLDRTLVQLPGVLEELRRGGPDLATVTGKLGQLADQAAPALPDLKASLRDLEPVIRSAPPILERAAPLVGEARTIVDRIAAAAPQLTQLETELTPAARTLGGSVLPFISSDSRNGIPIYLQMTSALSSLTGALRGYQTDAQNPLGAGHLLRLGLYFDGTGWTEPPIPSCGLVGAISADAAAQLQALGLCTP
ncbi:MAG: phospholipid/cholesterol/gamma-HCH transport system substrate-binding protein [Solirubrobacterales bacterium]|jgi:phospholipid/cholesterol/gamma-HCH transport system substrate-binding protein|nr:phospholipid/cholesterol/gamma-HCH transport system substrate-binding protein [Solirubrobacterales bacterium]